MTPTHRDPAQERPSGTTKEEAEVARASDIEQQHGRAGNSHDSGPEPALPEVTADAVGTSGHIVAHEAAEAMAPQGQTGSPGADADRAAAERGGSD
ncbi:hypothetical protein JI739_03095 [Ramlibacter sp. AW1]|uniref:Uncharacterized protein n=1 Tax=Ramlibacter aurantiacus TaxID=2801330 RepID=A0A936ZKD2_9BURK|nr:hypothetical protein [Ramlibacter aurantiacus]MBL0419326.1 hypothetical protein [Ramlibacter aurantiacus]